MKHETSTISETLAHWYHSNKRELPWRDISDPYLIWISEIVLQQTRVNQGLDYYLRFISRFPNIASLANAEEDEVLKYWQGLGYYSRARNLHKAAQQIMSNYEGVFPQEYKEILKLSGVGVYTAAAISSFAFNQPFAVVDGNVYRVLSRLFAIETPIDTSSGHKEFATLAQELLDKENPGLHNQAIMEFGALQCVPVNPDCSICPLRENCMAYSKSLIDKLPIKERKTKIKNRYFNYVFIKQEGNTFLQQRKAQDIWKNLYEFPLIESTKLLEAHELIEQDTFKSMFTDTQKLVITNHSKDFKHILTHRHIYARFFIIETEDIQTEITSPIKIPISEIENFAVSRLTELFLEQDITNN